MFENGLHSDVHPRFQPEGTYRHATNVVYDGGTLLTEMGTRDVVALPIGYSIVGSVLLPDGRHVLFMRSATDSTVRTFDGTTLTTILSDATSHPEKLAFGSFVEAAFQVDRRGHTLLYWVDGVNEPRLLDLDAPPSTPFENSELSLIPSMGVCPAFSLDRVNDTGGALVSGSYQLALAFVAPGGTRTNYFYVSPPVSVSDEGSLETQYAPYNYDGAPEGTQTSKSISFSLTGIDTSFEALRVAVLFWKNGHDFEVRLLPDVALSGSSLSYTYTGFEDALPGSLDEIAVDRVGYASARTLAQMDGVLYLGGLAGREDIGYQKYANGILVEAVTERLPDAKEKGGYRDPVIAFSKKSFKRDEVYAFYISFVFRDGSESLAYHIPGREAAVDSSTGSGGIYVKDGVPSTALGAKGKFAVSGIATSSGTLTFQIGAASANVTVNTGDRDSLIAYRIGQQIDATIAGWHGGYDQIASRIIAGVSDTTGTAFNGTVFQVTSGTFGLTITPTNASGGRGATDGLGPVSFKFSNNKTITVSGANELFGGDDMTQVRDKILNAIDADSAFTAVGFDIIIGDPYKAILITTATATDVYNGPITYVKDSAGVYSGSTMILSAITGGSQVNETAAPDPTDTNYNEISDFESAKNFHFRSIPAASGMGYWENANETYSGSDAEIWEVAAGVGSYSGNTLAGQKVRHHHFPDFRYSKAYSEDTGEALALGVRFTNIQIPDEIKKRVCAYKIYYARRGENSRTILDQAFHLYAAVSGSKVSFQNRIEADTPSPATSSDLLALYPFHMLRTKENAGNIAFLKAVYETNLPTLGTDEIYVLRRVVAQTYVPNHAAAIPLPGFDESTAYTADNDRQEEKLLIRIQNGLANKKNYTWDLHAFRSDVYLPFQSQQLVSTGYLHTDLDNPDSADVFGGDTFVSYYRFGARQVSEKDVSPADGTQDTVTDPVTSEVIPLWNVDQREYSTVVESVDNTFLRHIGESLWQGYPPKTAAFRYENDRDLAYEEAPQEEKFTNWLGYNDAYSVVAAFKASSPASATGSSASYPTRIVRSQKASATAIENHQRIFLPEDFYDLPTIRGDLVKLVPFGDTILPHMERGLFRTRGREELVTGDFRAFLGAGDIFAVPPQELVSTPYGYGGLQDPLTALVTEHGYFFVDRASAKCFLLQDALIDLGDAGVSKALPDFLTGALRAGYDPEWQRILVTTDAATGEKTLSFDLTRKKWTSYHSYAPTTYFSGAEHFYSTSAGRIYEHGTGTQSGHFYAGNSDTIIEVSFPGEEAYHLQGLRLETILASIATGFEDDTVVAGHTNTFDEVRVSNDHQDTGVVALVLFDEADGSGNTRRVGRRWLVSGLRHDATPGGTPPLPSWAYQRRLRDTYQMVWLRRPNLSDGKIFRILRIEPNKGVRRP